jgi:hypothetical protein
VLRQGREHYPVSLHGVGLALGSAVGIDAWHLDQLARLVEQIDPIRVSDHTCYARGTSCPVSLCGAMHAAWLQGRPRWGPGSKNPPAQWSLPAFYGTACSPAQTKLHPTD